MSQAQSPGVDWSALRAAVAEAGTRIARAADPESATLRRIYAERTAALARRRALAAGDAPRLTALAFRLGQDRYALTLSELAGIALLRRWAPLPGARPEVIGVISRPSGLRPLVWLSRILGVTPPGTVPPAYVLFLRSPAGELGLAIDGPEGLVSLTLPEAAAPMAGYREHRVGALIDDDLLLLDAAALRNHPVFME